MEIGDALQVMRDAVWITLLISAPFLVAGVVVGVVVTIIQAATQLQEGTLTFVPKAIIVVILVAVTGTSAITTMVEFTNRLMDRAVDIGAN